MRDRTRIMFGSAAVALGALVALGPRYLLPVCDYRDTGPAAGGGAMEGMSHAGHAGHTMAASGASEHMACFYTARAALVAGIFIAVIGAAIILAKKLPLRRLSGAVLAASGAAVVLIPLYIYPTCKSPEMICNQGAKQMLIVLGGAIALAGAWLVFSPERQFEGMAHSALEV